MRLLIDDPEKPAVYLINWSNKTSISQIDLNFLEDSYDDNFDDSDSEGERKKYLVVSYKAEGINTYNVFVFDIETRFIRFWYESYQLYESPVKGFLLPTKEFLILSKDGINVIYLRSKGQRNITDLDG